jgi:hypothetical protein
VNPLILFRKHDMSEEEYAAAYKDFDLVSQRTEIGENKLVIGRYSVLPFYLELDNDIKNQGSKLINSYREHRYIADLRNWATDLADLTPRTWDRFEYLPDGLSFVVKGETNSRKDRWDTHMFAKNKREVINIASRLQDDSLLSQQTIYAREYVPLRTFMIGHSQLPITNEFRIFIAFNEVVAKGYYWANYVDDLNDIGIKPNVDSIPDHFIKQVIGRIGDNATFYAVDVAETQLGEWIVVEVNDGQMSGLSTIDPNVFYLRLRNICERKGFTT